MYSIDNRVQELANSFCFIYVCFVCVNIYLNDPVEYLQRVPNLWTYSYLTSAHSFLLLEYKNNDQSLLCIK